MAQYLLTTNLRYEGMEKTDRQVVDPILERYARKALILVQHHWSNWKDGTGRSRAAWSARVQEGRIVLENPLGYVMYVHKAGEAGLFVETVMARVTATLAPELQKEIEGALREAMKPETTGEIKL